MKNIIDYLIYLIPIILIMTIINIILSKRKVNSNYKYLINGISLILIALTINNLSIYIKEIITFKFLSVKLYIGTLIITNIIALITIKKNLKTSHKILNYLLFLVTGIILILLLIIITGIKLNILKSTNNILTIKLLNISIITFIIYLIALSSLYIIKNINIKDHIITKQKKKIEVIEKPKEEPHILSKEELLSLKNKEEFTINGVECSIIFEDSINENIIKNYHILLNNIEDKLVNGYTLEENKLLKSICSKLQTTNLNYIDLNNLTILNKISVEEYNLLKQIHEK